MTDDLTPSDSEVLSTAVTRGSEPWGTHRGNSSSVRRLAKLGFIRSVGLKPGGTTQYVVTDAGIEAHRGRKEG